MENQNKKLILDIYSRIFGQGDLKFANSIIAENYIQHNPMVKTGKSGFMEFLTMLKHLPKPENPKKPFMRLICDDNIVAVHSKIEFMGKENAVVDLFRIENGLLQEHWDAVYEINSENTNTTIVEGTRELDHEESTEKNKQIVSEFVSSILVNRKTNKWASFLASDLAQHDPGIKNGAENLLIAYGKYESFKLHQIIGEHNFVLTQSEIRISEKLFVLYDIYRLQKTKIQEHWSVKQIIPDKMAHSNGMI